MDQDNLAKNMLANRICDNCKLKSFGMGIRRCKKGGTLDIFEFAPEENTCEKWTKND